jgi:aspartate-semialdehyde dehydrogenase
MDKSVPLVIPEVNPDAATGLLMANPNCSTVLLLLAVAPLHRAFGCRHVAVCTYQAVSGAGREAVERLRRETAQYLESAVAGSDTEAARTMAFNVWSHESPIDLETGMNEEEAKIIAETHKILDPKLQVSATCIRVPVERAHGEAVTVEFERPLFEADVRRVLAEAPGIRVVDDRGRGHAPTARMATCGDDVLVGRIRPDQASLDADGKASRYHFWLTGDQLRKGAALNAVQIAELPRTVRAQGSAR